MAVAVVGILWVRVFCRWMWKNLGIFRVGKGIFDLIWVILASVCMFLTTMFKKMKSKNSKWPPIFQNGCH